MADVEIKGMRELYETLSTKIPQGMEKALLQKALAAGTAEIVKRAKANIRGQVPEDYVGPPAPYPRSRTGTLKRAIYSARGKKSNAEQEVRIVNVRRGKRYQNRKSGSADAYYARMVEYGHRVGVAGSRLIRETRAKTKKGFDRYERLRAAGTLKGVHSMHKPVPPKPFMRPAWDSGQQAALQRITEKLRDVVEQAARRSRF